MKLHPGKKHLFILSFEVHEAVELSYLKSFIKDALESWGGQFHPNDELFESLEKVQTTHKLQKTCEKYGRCVSWTEKDQKEFERKLQQKDQKD